MTNLLLGQVYDQGRAKRVALASLIAQADDRVIENSDSEGNRAKRRSWERLSERLKIYSEGDAGIDANILNGRHPDINYSGTPAQAILEGWSLQLVSEGKRIDEYIDTLLVDAIALPFNLPTLPSQAEGQLTSVLNFRDDIRAYEREVEDFLEEVSRKASARIDVLPVTQMLNQIQRTYDRAYDVCALKVTTITNAWTTAASLIVAVVAAVIAIAGIIVTAQS